MVIMSFCIEGCSWLVKFSENWSHVASRAFTELISTGATSDRSTSISSATVVHQNTTTPKSKKNMSPGRRALPLSRPPLTAPSSELTCSTSGASAGNLRNPCAPTRGSPRSTAASFTRSSRSAMQNIRISRCALLSSASDCVSDPSSIESETRRARDPCCPPPDFFRACCGSITTRCFFGKSAPAVLHTGTAAGDNARRIIARERAAVLGTAAPLALLGFSETPSTGRAVAPAPACCHGADIAGIVLVLCTCQTLRRRRHCRGGMSGSSAVSWSSGCSPSYKLTNRFKLPPSWVDSYGSFQPRR
mmetsp:Transcript_11378/g.20574  ORF Transcript_11378/g.20574 Transcript_11378/m.20574 type:complete len:304 (+) Transcript_11378:930-1841(+)